MPRRFLAQACLVLLAAVFAQAKPPQSGTAISQTLQAIEQSWIKAENNRDAAAFEQIVADDWIGIEPDGKPQTKAERAASIKAGPGGSATISNMKVRVFDDTAVVTGADDEVIMKDGKDVGTHYVWTDVFVKRNRKWQAVASQTSPIN